MDRFIVPIPGFAEPVASWLHLLAAAIALVMAYRLISRGGDGATRGGIAVFAFGAVFLFAMSGTYHLLARGGTARQVLLRLDYAAIWSMIAGTLTGFHLTAFRGFFWRWGVTIAVWVLAITGIVLKTVFFEELSEGVTLTLLLALGWIGFLTFVRLTRLHGRDLARPLLTGGLVYTAGAIADYVGHPVLFPGVVAAHELFHVAVIVGALLHAYGIALVARRMAERSRAGLEVAPARLSLNP